VQDKGRDLWLFARYQPTPEAPAINWRSWYDEVARVLDPGNRLPFDPEETIPDTSVKYATALRFESAVEARAEWEATKDQLLRVLDVSAALGLLTDVKGRPPLLVIPRPPDFPLDRSGPRLKELQEAYPRYRTEFVVVGLPDAMIASVKQAARANLEYLLEPARSAVLQQISKIDPRSESAATWAKVADWLAGNPPELAAWRVLALTLARLTSADAIDPVSAMTSFLKKTSFTIEINQVTLEVPFRYADARPAAGASFEIYHPATTADSAAIVCELVGDPKRDDEKKLTTYTYRPRDRRSLVYRPGDELWATLKLHDERSLTWSRGHSTVYQFERLLRPPRLHRTTEASDEGELEEGINLIIAPSDGVPRIPDLMPVVKNAK
jgi:hypothetical protein